MARKPNVKFKQLPLRDNPNGTVMLLATFALLALGIVMVHSAVASVVSPGKWYARLDIRHTVFSCMALLIMFTAWRIDYHVLFAGKHFPVMPVILLVIAIVCAFMVYVPGIGHGVGGRLRWIRLGPAQYKIGFQPSEILKITLVIFLAAWLSRPTVQLRSITKTFLPAILMVLFCVGIVIKEDLGTAVLIGISACVTMLLAGVPWYYLASLIPPAAAGFYLLIVRDPHRLSRITAMLDPWSQANPSAYQPRMSLLAILTGGWFGKGPGNGELKLGFLPEDTTDFIFAVYAEEWGFVGAVLLIGLFILWILQARKAAVHADDRFGKVLAGSLAFMIAIQAVLHIAVDTVVLPPTGMSLPFVSAGGTALLLLASAVAFIISVTAHRDDPTRIRDW